MEKNLEVVVASSFIPAPLTQVIAKCMGIEIHVATHVCDMTDSCQNRVVG